MRFEHVVLMFFSFTLGLLTNSFLPKYFGRKGDNLATKEDIGEITDKIETVKHDYASQLESVKAELSAKLSTYGFRYEKEYEVLDELTTLLVDVRDASISMRPILDVRDAEKTKDDIKKERLKRFFDARRSLYIAREKKRPLYPEEIYQTIVAIEKIAHTESIDYQYEDPFEKGNFLSYWESAEKNQKEITGLVETAMMKIRARVTTWEALHNGL